MAYTDKVKSTYVAIAIGDGATPTEVFSPMCGITTKGLSRTRQTSETPDWDCSDPDAPPKLVRDMGATDWSISGSGLLHAPLYETVRDAYTSSTPTNFRFDLGGNIDGYEQGSGIISQFDVNGENGNFMQISITIVAADDLSFTANA
ncbi:phage tail tube protein [Sphingomonas sp.]|uniref:phage tail tube protein n=1 Tax=Sphingomonas sp. TaxID=28214 RepID=UPI003F72BB6B